MTDPRYTRLAKTICRWSIRVRPEEKVLINCYSSFGWPLAKEVYKEALFLGAFPEINYKSDTLDYFYFRHADSKQLKAKPTIALFQAKWADKTVSLVGETNNCELASADPQKLALRLKIVKPVRDMVLTKPWVTTFVPTPSLAQAAGCSRQEAEEIYFNASLQDWPVVDRRWRQKKAVLDKVKTLRIRALKTDLKLDFTGRSFCVCAGQYNLPDGEIFAAPLETKTEGHIFFDFPSTRQGKAVEEAWFKFKKGRVIKFTARTNAAYLKKSLYVDRGASRLGEFAFGLNDGLKKFMNNTIFDEKMGGTIHLALGCAYNPKQDGGGINQSAIHWDFVKDMRQKGSAVWADGKLIFKDGRLLI